LYNKRFEVFTSSLRLYQELMADGSSFETNKDFINKKEAAKFLFSKDKSIYSLLDEMHTKSFKINHFKNDRDELAQNPESFKIASDSSLEAVKWFNFAIKELSKKLEPFLSL
jgi:hypothetical protein